MKKVALILLSLLLTLGCVTSFAAAGIVTWDEECAEGMLEGNSLNDSNVDSSVNRLRSEWTASRGMPQENAIWVSENDNVMLHITGSEFITADSTIKLDSYATMDLRLNKLGDFCGMIVDCNYETYNSSSFYVDLSNEHYFLHNGYGFTVIDNNTVRAFVNNLEGKEVKYADFELGFDASADFHTYAIYKSTENRIAYLAIDEKIIASFDFSKEDKAKYGIYAADGTEKAIGAKDAFASGFVMIAFIGDELDIYLDNVGYDFFDELPNGEKKPRPTAEPEDEGDIPAGPTKAPETTKAPANATEAPKETKAPEETSENSGSKSGCGGMISAGALTACAAAVLVFRKKER